MFEDLAEAREQILRDKHTLLEGYVSEYLFEQQFLKPSKWHFYTGYTAGWWSATAGERRFFFLLSPEANDIDRQVKILLSPGYEVWRAYPIGNEWHFYQDGRELTLTAFLSEFRLTDSGRGETAAARVRDAARQERCLTFFETHGLLQKIAVERNFADDVLSVYFAAPVNIDFIGKKPSGRLCVLEVKFKFESALGAFGINVGQLHMFELLSDAGLEIEHWILYNKTRDKDLSIFGFLALPGKKWWRRGTLHTEVKGAQRSAPAVTSVQGDRPQNYVEFDAEGFPFTAPLESSI